MVWKVVNIIKWKNEKRHHHCNWFRKSISENWTGFHDLRKLENLSLHDTGFHEKLTASQWWKTESFLLEIRKKTGFPVSPLLYNIILEFLSRAIRLEKENIQIAREGVKLFVFSNNMILYIQSPIRNQQKNSYQN